MKKKPIDSITSTPAVPQLLFNKAQSIVRACQTITSQLPELTPELRTKAPQLVQQQSQLQASLRAAITAFGKLTQVQKAPLATPVDHGVDIFEAITDNIETSAQKFKIASKHTVATESKEVPKVPVRPQQLYKGIKPAVFDFHSHQKSLDHIRTDTSLTNALSLDEPVIYVHTMGQLEQMVEELSHVSQIAVDVEHSNKSYEGFTCLLQFSSREKDYIVDVFPIWESVPLLKRVMENQHIVKVMHGAEMDTKWFQRDFNVHIHNLFDTYRAARVLGLQKLSYAFLLSHYCNVLTDKQYQLADWRQRPLSKQMLHYARLDTHYLLEIFDKLRRDVHQKALSMNLNPEQVIENVYAASHEVTKNEVELFNFRMKQFFIQLKKDTKEEEFKLFDNVFGMLDDIAREDDIGFDEIVTHKVERSIIARLRDLLFLKSHDSIGIKIDSLISVLRQQVQPALSEEKLASIKEEVVNFFKQFKVVSQVPSGKKSKKKHKVKHIEDEVATEQNKPIKPSVPVILQEYSQHTYEEANFNPFTLLKFEPITAFVAKRHGIQEKNTEQEQAVQDSSEEEEEDEQEVAEQEKVEQPKQEGVIEFKRMNPNVIYTVEDAVPQEQPTHKPRKKRKELQYERRLKNKDGNIFEMLQD